MENAVIEIASFLKLCIIIDYSSSCYFCISLQTPDFVLLNVSALSVDLVIL